MQAASVKKAGARGRRLQAGSLTGSGSGPGTNLPTNVQQLIDSLLASASPGDVPRNYRGLVAFATPADAALLPRALRAPALANASNGSGVVITAAAASRSSQVDDWVRGFLADDLAYTGVSSISSVSSGSRRRHLAAAKGKQPQQRYQWQEPAPPLKRVRCWSRVWPACLLCGPAHPQEQFGAAVWRLLRDVPTGWHTSLPAVS